ncbi:MAG: hypothetical protein NXI31_03755 [bacterium]|nr:hypothetical protein [bacterium]
MRHATARPFWSCLTLALLGLLSSCMSLSSDEQAQLADFQRRAKLYWEGNRLNQALGQIDRGLEIEPEDYTLRTMQATILLRQSPSSQGTDHAQLDRAAKVFEEVYETRDPQRHDRGLLFNFALALQKQARRYSGEATRLKARGRIDSTVDPKAVAELRQRADERFGRAKELLLVLVDNGELLRLAHYHLLLGARDTNDHAGVIEHSKKYFKFSSGGQAYAKAEISRTNEPGYEQDKKAQLAVLRREELEVRSLLAEYHYARDEYTAALPMLDRVLEIDPARSTDYYNRGRVLLNLGQTGKAKADFRKFLATTDLPATSEKAVFAAAQISN